MRLLHFRLACRCTVILVLAISFNSDLLAQDSLAHRKSMLTFDVRDAAGNPITDATVNLKMTKHAFQFGSQVRDRLYAIPQSEFEALSTTQKQGLLESSNATYTPDWQDVLNYRSAVQENFNHVIPTNGMQWLTYENRGPSFSDAAIAQAQSNGLNVTGHAVVWGNDGWPTPTRYRPGSNPDAQTFYDDLIAQRLGPAGIMTRYSDTGVGPNVIDWDVVNEPINESYYTNTFVNAGIYSSRNEALADFFIRADTLRPDATLGINEYNILNSGGDGNAQNYRDLVNDLLSRGAPIDRIKVQAHMGRMLSKADVMRRLDILAETGLPIVISEFDMRDDANQLSPEEQEQLFLNMLEASFEHESVAGFSMWGFWDPGHWRGNGPLFDENWTMKDEASPWFDLVRGDWMTELNGLALDGQGMWSGDIIDGTYDIDITFSDGRTKKFSGVGVTDNMTFFVTVPEPSAFAVIGIFAIATIVRRKRLPLGN